jgi:uncharacterized protein (DUF433 family)
MALDWSQCPEVESVAGKLSGAWVFKDTRMPVSLVFENLELGASIEEIMEWHHLTRDRIVAVLGFAAPCRDAETPGEFAAQFRIDVQDKLAVVIPETDSGDRD